MNKKSKILVTGGRGLVGSALVDRLRLLGYENVIAAGSKECDLTDMQQSLDYFKKVRPEFVFHTAAHVFGIMGNMCNQGESFLKNLLINTHVVEASRQIEVKKIVAMGSGCVYPYPSPGLPLKEDMVWSGEPHSSEWAYAQAKRAMYAQLKAYKDNYNLSYAFVISGNLFGPRDKFDIEFGHVTPSLVRKFYEAKQSGGTVSVWGDGSARRDFMYVDDVADAMIHIMDHLEGPVNMGSSVVSSIRQIVDHLAEITGLQSKVVWDSSKPNGQDYRAYDLSALNSTGFKARTSLKEGLEKTFAWYCEHANESRK